MFVGLFFGWLVVLFDCFFACLLVCLFVRLFAGLFAGWLVVLFLGCRCVFADFGLLICHPTSRRVGWRSQTGKTDLAEIRLKAFSISFCL